MSKRDYYEVLGVEKGADDKTIKSAFVNLLWRIILTVIRVIALLKTVSVRQMRPMIS